MPTEEVCGTTLNEDTGTYSFGDHFRNTAEQWSVH
jgi:hypothetical protein